MRYRNDTEAAMTVAADPPVTVGPGEEIDLPDHVAGLTCLDGPDPAPTDSDTGASAEPAPKPNRSRRTNDTAEEA